MTITWNQRSTCNLMLVMIVLLPISVVLIVGLGWFSKLQTLDDNIDRDLARLQSYRGIAASLPALRQALDAEQSNDAFKAFYFDADTPGLAGAQLQTQVQEMVRTAGARPISTQILPTDDEDEPPRVSVRIQLQGTTDQLFDLLYRIESARPFLLVDQLSIRSQARSNVSVRQRARRRPAVNENQEQLTVRLDIYGYFLRPTG